MNILALEIIQKCIQLLFVHFTYSRLLSLSLSLHPSSFSFYDLVSSNTISGNFTKFPTSFIQHNTNLPFTNNTSF